MMVASVAGSWSATGPFLAQNLFPIFLIVILRISPLRRPSSAQVSGPAGTTGVDLGGNLFLLDYRDRGQSGKLGCFRLFRFLAIHISADRSPRFMRVQNSKMSVMKIPLAQ